MKRRAAAASAPSAIVALSTVGPLAQAGPSTRGLFQLRRCRITLISPASHSASSSTAVAGAKPVLFHARLIVLVVTSHQPLRVKPRTKLHVLVILIAIIIEVVITAASLLIASRRNTGRTGYQLQHTSTNDTKCPGSMTLLQVIARICQPDCELLHSASRP